MIFGTWELHSQAPKMVKSFKGVQEESFLEKSNLTMHQTYDDNSDLPQYPCIAVGESSSGKYCFPFSLLSSQSFLLFGDLFPK
jgi:hypothetical protein